MVKMHKIAANKYIKLVRVADERPDMHDWKCILGLMHFKDDADVKPIQ